MKYTNLIVGICCGAVAISLKGAGDVMFYVNAALAVANITVFIMSE